MIPYSKKILIIGGMVLMLFIGIAIGNGFKQYNISFVVDSPTPVGDNAPLVESVSKNKEENDEIAVSESPPSYEIMDGQSNSDNDLVKVARVIDGDTIEIEGGERVRYIGIDAPETVDPREPVQCFGVEAFNKNKELVEDKMVRLEKDITDRDKYSRLVRYVWVGDLLVNLELVKQGFAYSYSYPPDVKYQDQFLKAQQEARESKLGLWNSCPVVQDQSPLDNLGPTGQAVTSSPAPDQSGSCFIKGNISASGEKIYHLPGCGSYEKTKIDKGRGEKWFCTEAEAQAAGWRKALNCP